MRSETGSTIIESLASMLILGVILAMTTSVFSFSTRVFSRETVSVGLQGDVAGAKNVVLDDLSIAGYRPADLLVAGPFGAMPTDTFQNLGFGSPYDSVEFLGDIDSNGITERICYSVDATTQELQRSIQAAASACGTGLVETVAEAVQEFDLVYLDVNRAQLTKAEVEAGGATAARYVQVTLSVQAPIKGGTTLKTARGETAIRNRG